MPISAKELEEKLKNEIQATHLEIVDTSDGCGAKFQALIVSPQFEGKPLIQRHRLVHSTLEEELKDIHAFSMKTLTPEQWQKQNS
ncbi:bolA-like protein 2 [Mya arenaria]|uniref:bolA-like protein 2 n=1 Tax=Mya arenaria TaxID=6604 RepID=UPI0022E67D9D|nr:bolA-like protein 2 [Mya arenaria]